MITTERLLIRPRWRHGESLAGYVTRLFEVNRIQLNGPTVLAIKKTYHTTDLAEVRDLVSKLLDRFGIEHYREVLSNWLKFRKDHITGKLVRLVYRPRTNCAACTEQFGFQPAIWDLPGFDYCPLHHIWLNYFPLSTWTKAKRRTADQGNAALTITTVLASSVGDWLPDEYAPRLPNCSIRPPSIGEGYRLLATAIVLNRELIQGYGSRCLPTSLEEAIDVSRYAVRSLKAWLLPSIAEFEDHSLRPSSITSSLQLASGQLPNLIRLHQVTGWFAQNITSSTTLTLLSQLRAMAEKQYRISGRHLVELEQTACTPNIEDLGVLCLKKGANRAKEELVDYLQLYSRKHGIPALAFGSGGIVVNKAGSAEWMAPLNQTKTVAVLFTHEAPVSCVPASTLV